MMVLERKEREGRDNTRTLFIKKNQRPKELKAAQV
jgi:hypothetical protein